jgi:hypothetical protein
MILLIAIGLLPYFFNQNEVFIKTDIKCILTGFGYLLPAPHLFLTSGCSLQIVNAFAQISQSRPLLL